MLAYIAYNFAIFWVACSSISRILLMQPTANPSIFVVDDDEDDQFIIRQVLRQQAPTAFIQVLADGEALLTALSQALTLPQLVLLDLNMPRMGGLEALQRIRANAQYARVPVLVLTTSDSEEDRRQAQALHADGYLVKPATVDQLSQLISVVKQRWLQHWFNS